MPKKDLPEDQLQAVWRALDHDSSGFITTKEFGPFMKLGKASGDFTWKQRQQQVQDSKGAAARQEKASFGERIVFTCPPASAEVMTDVSRRLNAKMESIPDKHLRDWFKMFAHMVRFSSSALPFVPLGFPPSPASVGRPHRPLLRCLLPLAPSLPAPPCPPADPLFATRLSAARLSVTPARALDRRALPRQDDDKSGKITCGAHCAV